MLRGDKDRDSRRDVLVPGTALCFSVLLLWLAPHYDRWFGDRLPPFTQLYFGVYPLWLALSAAALALVVVGEQLPLLAGRPALRRALDAAFTLASILIVAAGIIALALPLLVPGEIG